MLRFVEAGMGASVEILLEASKNDLKIIEVPSSCRYKNGGVATSSENPVRHGMGVGMSLVRLIVEESPLTDAGHSRLGGSIRGNRVWALDAADLCG